MVIDFVIVFVFAICVFSGAKKGFVKTTIGLFTYILSCIIGMVFFEPFKKLICNFSFTGNALDKFKSGIEKKAEDIVMLHGGELPSVFKTYIDDSGDNIAEAVSRVAVEVLIAVLFFVAIIICLKLFFGFSAIAVRFPGLKQFNGFLGGVVGFVNGIIICYILGATCLFFVMSSYGEWVASQLETATFGVHFYKNNFILNILLGL